MTLARLRIKMSVYIYVTKVSDGTTTEVLFFFFCVRVFVFSLARAHSMPIGVDTQTRGVYICIIMYSDTLFLSTLRRRVVLFRNLL
jgi:hypothetical protein